MNQIIGMATEVLPSLIPSQVSSLVNPVLNFCQRDADPDCNRTVPEIIESRGFRSETHKVSTADGYILTLHRIINPFVVRKQLETYPVLLQHGIAAHSGHWLINSDDGYLEPMVDQNAMIRRASMPKKKLSNNLGFVLANLGYDVWLGNWRGNRYATKHKKFSSKSAEFWDFTIDDLVDHDLPALLDFVLKNTGKETLGYVGMSQGSNAMFGLLATKPEYNDKIKPFIALAPALKISNAIRIPVPVLKMNIPVPDIVKIPCLRMVNYYLQNTTPGPVLPFVEQMTRFFGSGNIFEDYVNQLSLFAVTKFYDMNVDAKRMSVYTAQANLALSKKNLAHLIQVNMFDEFTRYDHGDAINQKKYGCIDPPEYDLKSITNRNIALIYSKSDMWSSVADVDYISNSLSGELIDWLG